MDKFSVRNTIWFKRVGGRSLPVAASVSHELQPGVNRVLNEYRLRAEDSSSPDAQRQMAILLDELRTMGINLTWVGNKASTKVLFLVSGDRDISL